MNGFDAAYLAPTTFHPFLRALGRRDWVRFEIIQGNEGRCNIRENEIRASLRDAGPNPASLFAMANLFALIHRNNHFMAACSVLPIAALFAHGPKLFRPTHEQCLAFEQVTLNLTKDEYAQPFPALVIEFPESYRKLRGSTRCATVYNEPDKPVPLVSLLGSPWTRETIVEGRQAVEFVTVGRGDTRLEDALHMGSYVEKDKQRLEHQMRCHRVAFNCCLALTHFETRRKHLNPNYKQLKNRCYDKSNPHRQKLARAAIVGQFEVIEFAQDIKFHEGDAGKPTETATSGHHWEVRPHWRKGHWRRQLIGAGRLQQKLIFVKPILVRRDRFIGDIADTTVVYRG